MKKGQENKLLFSCVFVTRDKFPPFRPDVSVLFGDEIAGRGHTVDWILQPGINSSSSSRKKWKQCNVWVGKADYGQSLLSKMLNNFYDLVNDFRIFNLLKNYKYDFIIVKDKIVSAIIIIIAAKLYNTKVLYWLSFPYPDSDIYVSNVSKGSLSIFYRIRGEIFKYLLYYKIMRRVDHVFVQSKQMKIDVCSFGIPQKKVTPIPMGVTNEIFNSFLCNEVALNKKKNKVIIYLGTLNRMRRLDFVIRVFAKVLKKHPDAKLYMVGSADDPKDEEMLKDEVFKLGISDSVFFTGFLPREEAWGYVRLADIAVSPFYPTPILNSTSPTKLIEYLAMRKPAVVNDHPEQSLVISESGAGICVPYNESAFANGVIELLDNPCLATSMGEKGREYVERERAYNVIADHLEQKLISGCRFGWDVTDMEGN